MTDTKTADDLNFVASSMMDSKNLKIDRLMEQIISTYKTKASQLVALKQVLGLYYDEDAADKIAKEKMKEYNPKNRSGKSMQIALIGTTPLLHKVDELIAFIDDFNFVENHYDKIVIPQITYYRQLTGWTCGPACIRMILATLIDEKRTEKQLIKLLNSNPQDGTLQKSMISIGNNDKYKNVLKYQHSDYGSLNKLNQLTQNGWLCIVEWSLDDCPHFAIFSHDDNKCVYLKDPFFGKLYPVRKYDFIRRWNVYKSNYSGLNFVLRDRESCRWYLAFRFKKTNSFM